MKVSHEPHTDINIFDLFNLNERENIVVKMKTSHGYHQRYYVQSFGYKPGPLFFSVDFLINF